MMRNSKYDENYKDIITIVITYKMTNALFPRRVQIFRTPMNKKYITFNSHIIIVITNFFPFNARFECNKNQISIITKSTSSSSSSCS